MHIYKFMYMYIYIFICTYMHIGLVMVSLALFAVSSSLSHIHTHVCVYIRVCIYLHIYTRTGVGMGLLALFALFGVSGSLLPNMFSADTQVAILAQHLLVYVAIMQPINALVFVGDGIGQGSADFTYLRYAKQLETQSDCGL